MSIDLYPALDLGRTEVAVALERVPTAGEVAPVGAASLLYRNDDEEWPDEAGDDLVTRCPGITYQNLARDGATIGDVFGEQLPQLEETDAPTLVTLTMGGYDLLSAVAGKPGRELMMRIAADVAEAYEFLVDSVRRTRPESTVVVTTLYDPSDGTGTIPGAFEGKTAMPLEALAKLNESIRTLARGTPDVVVGDAHARFLGHGVTAPEAERWYWRRSLVELNARGASELRLAWLEALRPVLGD